jgi:histidinol-phosphate aminotransferase
MSPEGPGAALPDPAAALALLKPAVRAQAAYGLEAPTAARKLNQNEAPLDLPADLKQQVLQRAAALAWHRYPAFIPEQLCATIARRHRWVADGVLTGNGSNEVIQATLTVTVGEGTPVVAPSPTFSLYRLLTGVLGGRYVPVPLGPEYNYDVDALITAARREDARVIVLNSPNNPTGSALPEGAIERFLAETRALIVCDEAYQEFGGPTAIPLLHSNPRIVVLRTFSKAMGMAGLRFGYALAHPDLTREIAKAKLPYNVNALTLAAAEVAFEQQERFATRTRETIAERERLFAGLRQIEGLKPFPSAANFILFRCDAVPVFRALIADAGILVRDVSAGQGLAECLRVSVGTREDTDAVLSALRAIFS